jgi:hypothetical protein
MLSGPAYGHDSSSRLSVVSWLARAFCVPRDAGRKRIEADIITSPARTLEGRTFAAATGAYRPTGLR